MYKTLTLDVKGKMKNKTMRWRISYEIF
jgi:hypothetical protein